MLDPLPTLIRVPQPISILTVSIAQSNGLSSSLMVFDKYGHSFLPSRGFWGGVHPHSTCIRLTLPLLKLLTIQESHIQDKEDGCKAHNQSQCLYHSLLIYWLCPEIYFIQIEPMFINCSYFWWDPLDNKPCQLYILRTI